jgi:hypothetical protein
LEGHLSLRYEVSKKSPSFFIFLLCCILLACSVALAVVQAFPRKRSEKMSHLPERRLRPIVGPAALLSMGIITACVAWVFTLNLAEAASPDRTAAVQAGSENKSKDEAKGEFERLIGRWVRLDGGYIIEIKKIDSDGKMDAAYYNPKPIRVSKAEATQEDSVLKVFIELRDVGYPGSTYTLTYDPKTDQLKGVYFQAAIRQNFDVVFFKIK